MSKRKYKISYHNIELIKTFADIGKNYDVLAKKHSTIEHKP